MQQNKSADQLQDAISDSLFPNVESVSDVKQVLAQMQEVGQNLQEDELKAIMLLQQLGSNDYLHGDKNPYESTIKFIRDSKQDVVDPEFYLRTIEELIPKPPKPIVMAESGKQIDPKGAKK